MIQYRPRLNEQQYKLTQQKGTLVIGDLHSPFIKKGYLEFCKDISYKYNCNNVIFIGDLLDCHYSSYHETDPDGMGAGQELDKAIKELDKWHEAFPKAKVCIGNHDAIPNRKGFTSGLSKRWIKTVDEVLGYEGWKYAEEFIIDDVLYTHGTGRKARNRCKDDMLSIVQGHYHSESYIEYFVGERFKMFAMQIGCGVDRTAYAMAYGKHFKKMHINCGIILDGIPILEYMNL